MSMNEYFLFVACVYVCAFMNKNIENTELL